MHVRAHVHVHIQGGIKTGTLGKNGYNALTASKINGFRRFQSGYHQLHGERIWLKGALQLSGIFNRS